MFRPLALLILLLTACTLQAQNLVPNPGFEQYTNCPYQRSNVAYSPGFTDFPSVSSWVSAVSLTTPDYYNTCATDTLVSLPKNTYNDYQRPRGGEGCAGVAMMSGYPFDLPRSDWREYLETRLTEPMEAGQQYYISYFTNLTFHRPWDYVEIAVDQIGARVTDSQINMNYSWGEGQLVVNGPSSITTPTLTYITDTAAWVKVSGLYTAHGGEQWLTLGYFRDSLPIHHVVLYSPVADTYSIHVVCYMYIDDVCVSKVSPPQHDTLYASSFPYVINGDAQADDHTWSTGETTSGISVNGNGTYWVISSDDCYYKVDTITVLCNVQTANTNTTIYTTGFPYVISGDPQAGDHNWSTGETTSTITVSESGTYWVISSDDCHYRVDTITVLCAELTTRTDTTIYTSGFPLSIFSPLNADSMWWSDGSDQQSIVINSSGNYEVYAWENCRFYIHTIEVKQRDAADCLWLPSVFSPNGDGKNDAFGPVFSCYTLPPFYTFNIYNRFGECVFETDSPEEKWDGNYKGRHADVGSYYYMLRYSSKAKGTKANDHDVTLLKGDLTLIR